MTAYQYGTMKYIAREHPKVETARLMHQVTLSSLFYHNWIMVDHGKLKPTSEGMETFENESYKMRGYNERPEGAARNKVSPSVQKQMYRYRVVAINRKSAA